MRRHEKVIGLTLDDFDRLAAQATSTRQLIDGLLTAPLRNARTGDEPDDRVLADRQRNGRRFLTTRRLGFPHVVTGLAVTAANGNMPWSLDFATVGPDVQPPSPDRW